MRSHDYFVNGFPLHRRCLTICIQSYWSIGRCAYKSIPRQSESNPVLTTTPRSSSIHSPTTYFNMCSMECFGDQYRGCGHYVRIYQTGITYDCARPNCKLSAAHMHKTAKNCGCNMEFSDHRRVRNLFQTKCEACLEYEGGGSDVYGHRTGPHW